MEIRPLNKIRVLDLTQEICGPFCTQLLGDLGAEIIKIESPKGDRSRDMGVKYGETSLAYIHTNRGKKSVKLDIEKPSHKEVLLKLAEKSDVIVEDLGPGKSEDCGIGYEEIKKVNPNIIYLSISDFGTKGPFKDYQGNDAIVQAMSGFTSVTSIKKMGTPTKIAPPIADILAGVYGAIVSVAAVIYRKRYEEGLYMELSKLSAMMLLMPDAYARYLTSGEKAVPTGNAHRMSASFYPMPAKDGAIICNADNRNSTEHKFEDFCDGIGMPDFYKDDKYSTPESRLAHREEVEVAINEHTSKMTVNEIAELCHKIGISAGTVNDMKQLAEDPQVLHDQIIIKVHDNKAGDFKVLGCPFKFDKFDTPKEDFSDQLGEHTEEVLKTILQMTESEIAEIIQ